MFSVYVSVIVTTINIMRTLPIRLNPMVTVVVAQEASDVTEVSVYCLPVSMSQYSNS